MNIDEILESMDDLLDSSTTVPFVNKKLIDADQMRDLINDVRLNIPQEIKRAKLIDFDRDRIMKAAEEKADKIIADAENRAKVLVSNEEITKEAKNQAVSILDKARKTSNDVRKALDIYVDRKLSDTEESINQTLDSVKSVHDKYKNMTKND